jgi:ribosomal protein S18 acetylase RimI-like enzyme
MTRPPAGIRCAVADDPDGILRADPVAAQGDPERAEFLRSSLMLGQCQVHVADGAVTGFVIARPAHFFGRDFIELLIVDPALRRSGIGRALLRHALAAAGTSQVFTSTNTSNHPMRSLLEAEDWSFSGELDGLDDDLELVFYKTRPRSLPAASKGGAGGARTHDRRIMSPLL